MAGRKPIWPKVVTHGHASVRVYREAHPDTTTGWIYTVAWNSPAGRKREKFASESNAMSEAKLKAAQLSSGRVEGALLTAGDRDELAAARRIANGTPLVTALKEWAMARDMTFGNVLPAAREWAAHNGRAAKRTLVATVVDEFCAAKRTANRVMASGHLSVFNRIKADFDDRFIDSISSTELDRWLANWDHPVTRNTRRKRLVTIWRWARRRGYLPRNAQTEAEATEYAAEPAPEIGIIDCDRFERLLVFVAAKHRELLPALVLAGFCGLRRTEVHSQRWEDINLREGNLFVSNAKRGTPARRLVPICPAAIQWLLLAPNRTGSICPLVMGPKGPQPSLAIDGLRRIVRDAALFPGWTLPKNCFRHSYISHSVAASGDIARASLDAGTSAQKINRHYRQLVTPKEGMRWFSIAPTDFAGGAVVEFASATAGGNRR